MNRKWASLLATIGEHFHLYCDNSDDYNDKRVRDEETMHEWLLDYVPLEIPFVFPVFT